MALHFLSVLSLVAGVGLSGCCSNRTKKGRVIREGEKRGGEWAESPQKQEHSIVVQSTASSCLAELIRSSHPGLFSLTFPSLKSRNFHELFKRMTIRNFLFDEKVFFYSTNKDSDQLLPKTDV